MAACSMVYHSVLQKNKQNTIIFTTLIHSILHKHTTNIQTYLLGDRVLMSLCRDLVGVQFGGHDGDEVLEHVIC